MHTIKLLYIKCINSADNKSDDVYLEMQADGGVSLRYPFAGDGSLPTNPMSDNQTWWVGPDVGNDGYADGIELNFDYELLVTIWDQDSKIDPNTATFLVNNDFTFTGVSSTQQVTAQLENTDGATYQIGYQMMS